MPNSKLLDPRLDLKIRDIVGMSAAGLDIGWLLNPYIDGIEVTQAIQYYNADQHLTDQNDRGANNSVRLVAYKPAWVRVYLRTFFISQIPGITGELVIARRTGPYNAVWQTVATISARPPGNATATGINTVNYATERRTLGSTLNFIIPADDMFGYLRLTVRIWRPGNNDAANTYSEDIDATLLQTLRLRGIFISYNGPDAAGTGTLSLAAPTLADLQNTSAWTLTVDPVQSTGSYASAGSLQWGTPLTGVATAPGGCSTQWLQLNAAVAQVKANDGNRNDVIYYGLLPNGVPIANVGGCESSGVSTGPNGAQGTMAHEVGHGAGLGHGPCGTTSGDPNYPAYEPYETPAARIASIGEYGLNINNGAIMDPAINDDYMSYCNQTWISLYHHARLINVARFDPKVVGVNHWRPPDLVDPWLWPWEILKPGPVEDQRWDRRYLKAEPVISIIGIVDIEGRVDIQSVMRVTALPQTEDMRETQFTAELLNHNRQVISRSPLMRVLSHGCDGYGKGGRKDCGCPDDQNRESRGPFIFQAMLPDIEDGAMLRINLQKEGNEESLEVWSRQAPSNKPRIGSFEVDVREREGFARWEVGRSSDERLEFSLQYSKDEGRSWNGLAVRLREHEFRFDLSTLPSGPVIFALLAHDGFHTTKVVSKTVELPRRGAVISILYPREGALLVENQPMRLWGAVSTDTAERIDREACRWLIDGEEVTRGVDDWISAPKSGEHDCTFVVEYNGVVSETSTRFVTESIE